MRTAARARSLPTRYPLAQGIALALALGAGATQADGFNVTSNADNGSGSLRQAVAIATANPGADQITFSDGVGTIALTSGQIDITETLTITGPAGGQTIDAGINSRIFAVTVADQPLTVENLTLIGGQTTADGDLDTTCADDTGEGGGTCALGDVTLTNSTVSGNSTAGDYAAGGGLSVSNGSATLTNSTVSGNNTSGHSARGGGVIAGGFDSVLTLTNSTVSGNSASGSRAYGGGISFLYGDASLRNSTITGNQSAAGAGGLHIEAFAGQRTLTLASAVLAANSGLDGNFGAAIDNGGSATLNASHSLFGDNPAEINGINIDNIFTDTLEWVCWLTTAVQKLLAPRAQPPACRPMRC